MNESFRDDCPPEFNLLRRHFLAGGVTAAGLAAGSFAVAASAATAIPLSKFMEISSLLVNHQLNTEVGGRLAVAMSVAFPGFEQNADAILAIARSKNARIVEDFYPDIPPGKLQDTALAIISAWYSGVISETLGSEVYAYELALMYQPTLDVMTIPTYAISGPNGWNAVAPPLTDMPEF